MSKNSSSTNAESFFSQFHILFKSRLKDFKISSISIQISSTANIVDDMKRVVARREFVIDPKGARCLCLWYCSCFCFGSFIPAEANDLCRSMAPKSEIFAGFYDDNSIDEIESELKGSMELSKHFLLFVPLMVIAVALILGE